MSSDEPIKPERTFASRAERRRFERAQLAKPAVQCTPKAHKKPTAAPAPLTEAQALARVEPVRVQERQQWHQLGPVTHDTPVDTVIYELEKAVTAYAFTVYRRDGMRAVEHLVDAKLAHFHASSGESTLERARQMARVSGTARLVADLLAGEPADEGAENTPSVSPEALAILRPNR